MTCLSCAYSIRLPDGRLWCSFGDVPAVKRCRYFVYEPGTDEGVT